MTILEGEGLFNDATALVAFKVALAAAVTGGFSVGGTLEEAAISIGVGVPLGLALGWLTTRVLRLVDDGAAETTVTVLVPYLAYLGAEHLRGSGVLAVLSLGLFLTTFSHPSTTSEGWLLGRSVWEYADFLVTSLVFALVGYELVKVGADARLDATTLLHAGVVVVVLVGFRPLWVFPIAAVTRVRAKRRDEPIPTGWRESAVVSWAGMRGVVTVAAALSVPLMTTSGTELPGRDELLVIALSCVLVTLVVQGLTLQPLVTWLRVSGSSLDEVAELAKLRRKAAQQALRLVRRQMEQGEHQPPEVVRSAVVERYEGLIASQQAIEELRRGAEGADPDHETADQLARGCAGPPAPSATTSSSAAAAVWPAPRSPTRRCARSRAAPCARPGTEAILRRDHDAGARPARRVARRRRTPGACGARTWPAASGGRSARTTPPTATPGATCRSTRPRPAPTGGARTASAASATATASSTVRRAVERAATTGSRSGSSA